MINEQTEMFKEEAFELLEELETTLLELEKEPGDMGLIGKVFRALHTIKGSGSMFGFNEVAEFTHEVEDVFDFVRGGRLVATKELIDLTLSAGDIIKKMLGDEMTAAMKAQAEKIVTTLRSYPGEVQPGEEPKAKMAGEAITLEPPPEPTEDKKGEREITYRIRFNPSLDILQKGTNVLALFDELKELGEIKIVAHLHQVPTLEQMVPDECYIFWDIILTTRVSKDAIRDIFIFVENDSKILIDVVDDGQGNEDKDYMKLGYILVERGDLSVDDMNKALSSQKRFGEILLEEGVVEADKIESALVEQNHVRELRNKRQKEEIVSSLRVPADKADRLVNLVGELVTLQARLGQLAEQSIDPELISVSEETARLVWDLRDSTMGIRMVPIGNSFSRFNRLVRDLSNTLEKEVELIARGGDTELDKTVIERLHDPLIHLIRNGIDHGIETPVERRRLGKSPKGKITLTASYSGAHVLIVIEDDGAGIDPVKIKKKAIEKGLIKPDVEIPVKDIYSLLFEPGFSTAQEITNVSGRGVGMDVVKKNVDLLRGSVEIHSIKGKGTTITLKIPLTLAIIDGLLVYIETEHFIIPLSMVEEIVELTDKDVSRSHGRQMTNIRGSIVPYISLREYFSIPGQPPPVQQIVVVEVEQRHIGFVVDMVIGKHQTVIKSLGKIYKQVAGLSGATILGDGSIALILDMSRLALAAEIEDENPVKNKSSYKSEVEREEH